MQPETIARNEAFFWKSVEMDTLVIGARCASLILTTFVFVMLWSGDRPDHVAVRPAHSTIEDREMHPKARIHIYEPSPEDQAVDTSWIHSPIDSITPLPTDIVAGTYLMVDQSGHSSVRIVSGPEHVLGVEDRDHYSVEADGSRWHFIRLDIDRIQRTAEVPADDSVTR